MAASRVVLEAKALWAKCLDVKRKGGDLNETIHAPPDLDGTYRICTDMTAIISCAPGNMLEDLAVNAFVAELTAMCPNVVMAYSQFYAPGVGTIMGGYNINDICDRFLSHYEKKNARGILDADLFIIPINVPGHWRLGIVDFSNRRFDLYDSLRDASMEAVDFADNMKAFLYQYATARMKHLGRATVDITDIEGYEIRVNRGLEGEHGPVQADALSCGVFMLSVAVFRAFGEPLTLQAHHVPKLRAFITYTISTGDNPWVNMSEEFKSRPNIRTKRVHIVDDDDGMNGGDDIGMHGGVDVPNDRTSRYESVAARFFPFGMPQGFDTDNPPHPPSSHETRGTVMPSSTVKSARAPSLRNNIPWWEQPSSFADPVASVPSSVASSMVVMEARRADRMDLDEAPKVKPSEEPPRASSSWMNMALARPI